MCEDCWGEPCVCKMTFYEAMMQSTDATENQVREWCGEDGVTEWKERRDRSRVEATPVVIICDTQ